MAPQKNSLREKRHFFKTMDFHRSSTIYRSWEPLAVASCCQVRNSNILSCGQKAAQAAQGLTLVIHGESKFLRSSIQSVCVGLDPSSGLGSVDKWPIRLQTNHSLTG